MAYGSQYDSDGVEYVLDVNAACLVSFGSITGGESSCVCSFVSGTSGRYVGNKTGSLANRGHGSIYVHVFKEANNIYNM